ncbi:ADP-ribosylglycohydrolase family protein [Sporosarcina sp. Sa2YVA2]|uniref:ADP-ribosylglycohydrolase family protein n=1 Tax=Sporosarcina quadrami TaxID=2762234 RepID=A0ABR8U9Y2_9BACL|nr:ADP-ribosylglycohydrolase family protein [Sporosarcina quadrami]MBD7984523.1 ADP-ribosylglycohydrolase family protein [Sporosarcina quadrami]
MIPSNYLEKVYAGFLGMNAGIRLGAPVEPTEWTPEIIKDVYGDIKGYLKEYRTFSADDDANGPVFFIRSLIDEKRKDRFTANDVANAWLNYSREGIGMFWWGGEGISTEHTAYLNLEKGIPAPLSGSAETNGLIMSEQIGGQIFIDTWGMLFPNNPGKAADYAEIAASVSHDKNGLYGARFMAACIASAFSAANIDSVIEEGLKTIPTDSTYATIVKKVQEFHERHPDDFWKCRNYLEEEWGYDKYTGVCHIIPNAGVCVLALLYGDGNLARTIEIATMCGWDTDCNAGNVGSIVGVLAGINEIPENYRQPINDFIATSSVSGYLNILDIPTFVKSLALLAYELAEEVAPTSLVDSYKEEEVYFDFNLPGSTHGFKTDFPFKTFLKHNQRQGYTNSGVLEIFLDRMIEGERSRVFYKTFYRREDFNDEKYKPTFAPKAYSGQKVSMKILTERLRGNEFYLTPYVRSTYNKELIELNKIVLLDNEWQTIEFTIPETDGTFVDEVGIIIESPSTLTNRAFGKIYLDEFHIYGSSNYSIDFSKQSIEFLSVTPFAHHRGNWQLKDDAMIVESETDCSSFTGHYYTRDGSINATITPLSGCHHAIIFRAEGIKRYYQVGFYGNGNVALHLQDFGLSLLTSNNFDWVYGRDYNFEVLVRGNNIRFLIDGKEIINFNDSRYTHGMFGFSMAERGSCSIKDIKVKT